MTVGQNGSMIRIHGFSLLLYLNSKANKIFFIESCQLLTRRLCVNFKGLFHPACLARVVSWLAFVVLIFMEHGNGDDEGQPRNDTCKECWMKLTL